MQREMCIYMVNNTDDVCKSQRIVSICEYVHMFSVVLSVEP